MTDFSKLNITSALLGLKNKDFKSVELTEYFINQIDKKDSLNCFITKKVYLLARRLSCFILIHGKIVSMVKCWSPKPKLRVRIPFFL